jgi:CMP/dCMP kinase
MIITIAGTPGAGKTSVAKVLSERLGMKFYSVGGILEKIADKKKQTIDELLAGGDEADHEVDDYQKNLGKTENNIIIEGKISWYLIPDSFKILVTVDPVEGGRRIFEDRKIAGQRTDEPEYPSIEEAVKVNNARMQRYIGKFKRLYGIENYFDSKHYDFVIDTTKSTGAQENADRIMAELKERKLI